MNEIDKARLGLLPVLAERGTGGQIGRTALMKYLYFLQTLRGLPLGYKFSLYSYGPFDSEVLADLSSAESLQILSATPVQFSGGYGYRIRPGSRAESAKSNAVSFLNKYEKDIDWMFSIFGSLNSAELELASTVVYVDSECAENNQRQEADELAIKVSEIKPHFPDDQVKQFVKNLWKQKVLRSVKALQL